LKRLSLPKSRYAIPHQEQVPRKQGLKRPARNLIHKIVTGHQEQVPRKQGLKQEGDQFRDVPAFNIKSKFHENKD